MTKIVTAAKIVEKGQSSDSAIIIPREPARVKQVRVDGLLMLNPETLDAEGECPGGRYYYVDSVVRAVALLQYWSDRKCWAAIDLETGLAWRFENGIKKFINLIDPFTAPIYLCSVSVEPGVAVVFDMRSLMRDDHFIDAFKEFLTECQLVAHNSFFESSFLLAQFHVMPNIGFDTLVASQIINAGLTVGNGLKNLMQRYCDLETEKAYQKWFLAIHPNSPIPNEAIQYSAGDVCQLLTIAQRLEADLDDRDMSHIYWKIEHPLLPVVAEARYRGVTLDTEKLQTIQSELAAELRDIETTFNTIVGWKECTKNKLVLDEETGKRKRVPFTWQEPAVNIASAVQLKCWYQARGLHLDSTDANSLKNVSEMSGLSKQVSDLTSTVLRHRTTSKLLSTYCEPLLTTHLNPVTGRIHSTWKQCHAATGRMASEEPNMQNAPPKIRACFKAQDGHKLVIADYSQFELRVLAGLSEEPTMLEAFREGRDLHTQNALNLYPEKAIRATELLCMWAGLPPFGASTEILRTLWSDGLGEGKSSLQRLPPAQELRTRGRNGPDQEAWCRLWGQPGERDQQSVEGRHNSRSIEEIYEGCLRTLQQHQIPCSTSSGPQSEKQRRIELRDALSILPFVGASTLEESWTDFTRDRKIAKTYSFGIAYGAGPKALAVQTGLPIETARALYTKFFETNRVLKRWLDLTALRTQHTFCSTTSTGRKRFFERPDIKDELYQWKMGAIGREGTNAPIQGYNADCIKVAAADYARTSFGGKILLFVHDEIVVEAEANIVDAEVELLRVKMVRAAERWVTNVPFEVEIKVNDYWQK